MKMPFGFERTLIAEKILEFVLPAFVIVIFLLLAFFGIRKVAAKLGTVLRIFLVVTLSITLIVPFALAVSNKPQTTIIWLAVLWISTIGFQFTKPLFGGPLSDYKRRLEAEWDADSTDFTRNEKIILPLFAFLGAFFISEMTGAVHSAIRTEYAFFCSDQSLVVVRHYQDGLVTAPLIREQRIVTAEYRWVDISDVDEALCVGELGPLRFSSKE